MVLLTRLMLLHAKICAVIQRDIVCALDRVRFYVVLFPGVCLRLGRHYCWLYVDEWNTAFQDLSRPFV